MPDIRITPAVQLVIVIGLIAGIAAGISAQLPEIRRYLRVRSMS
jgi:hypothetical protein